MNWVKGIWSAVSGDDKTPNNNKSHTKRKTYLSYQCHECQEIQPYSEDQVFCNNVDCDEQIPKSPGLFQQEYECVEDEPQSNSHYNHDHGYQNHYGHPQQNQYHNHKHGHEQHSHRNTNNNNNHNDNRNYHPSRLNVSNYNQTNIMDNKQMESHLQTLKDCGFGDDKLNQQALLLHNGNLQVAIGWLCEQQEKTKENKNKVIDNHGMGKVHKNQHEQNDDDKKLQNEDNVNNFKFKDLDSILNDNKNNNNMKMEMEDDDDASHKSSPAQSPTNNKPKYVCKNCDTAFWVKGEATNHGANCNSFNMFCYCCSITYSAQYIFKAAH